MSPDGISQLGTEADSGARDARAAAQLARAEAGPRFLLRSIALAGIRRLYPWVTLTGAAAMLVCGGFVPVLARWLRDELDLADPLSVLEVLGGVWVGDDHRTSEADLGPALQRHDAPILFREVDKLSRRLGTRLPPQIHLAYLPCCGVVVGTHRRQPPTLLVGLPLLAVLTRSELRAALVHELAHLARGDAVRSLRALRFVESLARGVDHLPTPRDWLQRFSPLRAWSGWCLRVTRRLLGPVARGQENRADRDAAQIAGGESAAGALVKTALVQSLFREVLAHYEPDNANQPNLYAFFRQVWAKLPEPVLTTMRQRIMSDRHRDPDPAHPDLIDRLAAVLPYRSRPDQTDQQPATTVLCDPDALEQMLHDQLYLQGHRIETSLFHRAGS